MKKLLLTTGGLMLLFFTNQVNGQMINSFPHTENFETFANCPTGCGSACTLSNGWVNDVTDNIDWIAHNGATGSTTTGPSFDHTTGSTAGIYLYTEASCSGTGFPNMTANLHTPPIDLSNANAVQMEFWWHMYGQTMGNLHIDISNDGGTTWSNDIVPAWTDDNNLWQFSSVNLGAWSGDTVIVRFRGITGSNYYSDMAVDDFYFYDLIPHDAGIAAIDSPSFPTCNLGSSVYVTIENYGTQNLTSAEIHWEVNGQVQPTFNWTGSVASGQQETDIFIGTYPIVNGDDLKVWTALPNGNVELGSGAGNDTINTGIQEGLSGTFVIDGGGGGDYLSFTDAIDDLYIFGLCGPVIFEVTDGVYSEQVVLLEVMNASAVNTITFRGQSMDPNMVVIDYSPSGTGDNYVIAFDGGDYFHFEYMTVNNGGSTYGHALTYTGGAENNTFSNCVIKARDATSTNIDLTVIYSNSGNSLDHNNAFIDNTIQGGSYGVYWYGDGTADLEQGTVFDGNNFLNQYNYGSRLYYQDAPVFNNNTFTTNSTYTGSGYGHYFYYCDNGMQVWNNTINSSTNMLVYGMYFGNCDGNGNDMGWIANNMIHVGNAGSATTLYGIYFTNTGFQNVIHNSVLVESGSTVSRSFYGTSGGANIVKNNNFTTLGQGYSVYLASNYTIVEMDHNNLYTQGPVVAYYNGADQNLLGDWQQATGFDGNSISANPIYNGVNDLHVCNGLLDNAGTPVMQVTEDIDGQARDANTPDIGADEFVAIGNFTLGADTTICTGDTLTFWAGSPSDVVIWSTGDTSNTLDVMNPGVYFVDVAGACGAATDTIVVNASNLTYSNFIDATDTLLCIGDTITLSSNMMADNYTWSTFETTSSIDVTTSGTYNLTISDGCGSGSESIDVTFIDGPIGSFTFNVSFLTGIFNNNSLNSDTYFWDFGDGFTSSDEDPIHVYDTAGTYAVTLIVTNMCGADTVVGSISVYDVGVEESIFEGGIGIFPNPNSGLFNISMNLNESAEISVTVINTLGQEIHHTYLGKRSGQVNESIRLDQVNRGVYIVRITANDQTIVERIEIF